MYTAITSLAVCLGLLLVCATSLFATENSETRKLVLASANGPAGPAPDKDEQFTASPVAVSIPATILYLELVVNDVATGHIADVELRNGEFFLHRSDLTAVSLQVPNSTEERVSTATIDGLSTEYDASAQRLHLRTAPNQRDQQTILIEHRREYMESRTSLGAVFNYDFYASRSPYGNGFLSYWTEMRGFGSWGSFSNTGISRYTLSAPGSGPGASSAYMRYDTQWTRVDEKKMITYSLGDTVTRSLSSGSSVRMAGFTLSRNFRLRPDVISYPIPSLSGTATVPTSVDVLVNGTRMARENLNPGPFTVQGIPIMNGAGTATVITQDALGRTVENTVSFYLANDLLRRGLVDFSTSVGVLRRHYGARTAAYGSLVGSGIVRYGLTDAVTLNGQLELAGGLAQGGGGADFRVYRWGVLSTAASFSGADDLAASGGRQGYRLSAGYRYNSRLFRIQARQAVRSTDYRDLATYQEFNPQLISTNFRRSSEVTGGFAMGKLGGTISVGYFAFNNFSAPDTRISSITYSRRLFARTNLYLTANRSLVGTTDTTVQAQLIFSLGREGTFMAGVTRDPDGEYRQRIQYTKTAPPRGGVGVSASYGKSTNTEALNNSWKSLDVTWRRRDTQLRAGAFGQGSDATLWAGATGSLVLMDGKVFAANQIDDAFAVVRTGRQAGVPVMFENQVVGRTGRSGHLLVPWVASHYPGKFSIDPGSLPLEVEPKSVEQRVVVRRKSGALINFAVEEIQALHLRVVAPDGTSLPLGSVVEHQPSGLSTAVGWDGLVYLSGVDTPGKLRIRLSDGKACTVTVPAKATQSATGVPVQEYCR
jgi:outer membrane usher protein